MDLKCFLRNWRVEIIHYITEKQKQKKGKDWTDTEIAEIAEI